MAAAAYAGSHAQGVPAAFRTPPWTLPLPPWLSTFASMSRPFPRTVGRHSQLAGGRREISPQPPPSADAPEEGDECAALDRCAAAVALTGCGACEFLSLTSSRRRRESLFLPR